MRRHEGSDPWGRGSYDIPQHAIVGASDTGEFDDSPAPTHLVDAELENFRAVLRKNKIRSRFSYTRSGNVFMVKKWVVVSPADFQKAKEIALEYLRANDADTSYIHDADLALTT